MVVTSPPDARRRRSVTVARLAVPGLVVVAGLTGAATLLGGWLPLLGAPVVGVVAGVLLSPAARRRPSWAPGVAVAAGPLLRLAVVVLGSQLSLGEVAHVGVSALPVMLATLTACGVAAVLVARWWGVGRDLATLIGVGTGICGASAIAAVSPVIRARAPDVAYAISTIFVFNVAAVLLFPPLGHALHLGQQSFGLFAGTAVNDTSSVVATAGTYGPAALNHAVVVKLTRSLMIVPVTLVLGVLARRRALAAGATETEHATGPRGTLRLVPWFLVGFVAVAALNSLGLVPAGTHHALQAVAVTLITAALTAIGLGADPAALRRAGVRPLLLGALLWVVVTATSLGVQLA